MAVTANLIQASTGFLGYRATQGTTWTVGGGTSNWSGCYIGTTLDQAKGYIELDNGVAMVWSCSLANSYPLWCVQGPEISDPTIPSDVKADLIKPKIVPPIALADPLIPTLCQRSNQGYTGPDTETTNEIIIGWNCLGVVQYQGFREYKRVNYETTNWRPAGTQQWLPLSQEPAAPNSPVVC